MLQKYNKGLIIWGIILSVLGTIVSRLHRSASIFFCIIFFSMATIFIIIGVITNIKIYNHNKIVKEDDKKWQYQTECIYCHQTITCIPSDFKPHYRYPEGFVYCPYCKKPVSKRVFHAEETNI